MDIFRIFDALNDINQLEVGMKAVHKAGGVVEATVCYSGDMLNPKKKYNLEYYLDLVEKIVQIGTHVLGIKDMAGVLKPKAATMLIGSIRKKYPDLPIHVHCHDSAGTGIATYIACAQAGADAVDTATDSMSGMTSQPSIGALLASLEGSDHDPGLNGHNVRALDTYWAQLRLLYSPFEAGLTGPDPEVYEHEIPGGQLTNLIFQASQLGLGARWAETKKAYEQANDLLGDIVKVTPTSKVVGDLAQFMVSNKLNYDDVLKKAEQLDFPGSVLEFFEGLMGQPYGGFPEPLRTQALRGRRKLDKRPGLYLEPLDLAKIKKEINEKWGSSSECDVASYAMYPKVFEDYRKFVAKYGDLSVLPTRYFLAKPEIGEEFHVELEKGKVLILKMLAIGPLSDSTGQREVFYEMNGEVRQVTIDDNQAAVENTRRAKADSGDSSQVGAPMSGVVVEVRVHDGSEVKKGDPVAVLSAMKMVSPPITHSQHDPMLPIFPTSRLGTVFPVLFILDILRLKLMHGAGNGHQCPPLGQDWVAAGQGGRLGGRTRLGVQDREVDAGLVAVETHDVHGGRVSGRARGLSEERWMTKDDIVISRADRVVYSILWHSLDAHATTIEAVLLFERLPLSISYRMSLFSHGCLRLVLAGAAIGLIEARSAPVHAIPYLTLPSGQCSMHAC